MNAAIIGAVLGCSALVGTFVARRMRVRRRRMNVVETEIRLIEERLARPEAS